MFAAHMPTGGATNPVTDLTKLAASGGVKLTVTTFSIGTNSVGSTIMKITASLKLSRSLSAYTAIISSSKLQYQVSCASTVKTIVSTTTPSAAFLTGTAQTFTDTSSTGFNSKYTCGKPVNWSLVDGSLKVILTLATGSTVEILKA